MGQLAQSTFKTPEQVMQERLKQQQSMYASAQSPYERMGMAIGNILGGALGVQDPEMERASLTQQIYNDTLSMLPDTTSPEFYTTLARNLSSAGLAAEAAYSMQEARKYGLEERKMGLDERRVVATEEDIKLRREAELRKVSSEQTTTKGIRVFRRGNGPLLVEEGGKDVPYNEKKHGRFETAQDRTAPRGVTIKDITNRVGQVIGREFIDPITGDTIRKSYFEGMGPTDPGAGADGKKTMTNDEVRALVRGEQPTATDETRPVRSGRGRPVSNRVPTRPPEFILRGTNRIKNKAYDDWTAQYGATHNPDGTPK